MSALTPLDSIHKKGIFGNHHKKNQDDLLQISEEKKLAIVQIAQYKASKVDINQIKIENLTIIHENCSVSANNETRILWNAPRTWLVASKKENIIEIIKKKFPETDFSITDISHSRAVIKIKGDQAREVLKKGSPINFDELKINKCVGTVFHGISIVIDLISNEPDEFNILVLRSFGESFYHHITDAALEFGYAGV